MYSYSSAHGTIQNGCNFIKEYNTGEDLQDIVVMWDYLFCRDCSVESTVSIGHQYNFIPQGSSPAAAGIQTHLGLYAGKNQP